MCLNVVVSADCIEFYIVLPYKNNIYLITINAEIMVTFFFFQRLPNLSSSPFKMIYHTEMIGNQWQPWLWETLFNIENKTILFI